MKKQEIIDQIEKLNNAKVIDVIRDSDSNERKTVYRVNLQIIDGSTIDFSSETFVVLDEGTDKEASYYLGKDNLTASKIKVV